MGILHYSSFVYQEMPEEVQAEEEDGWKRDGDLLAQRSSVRGQAFTHSRATASRPDRLSCFAVPTSVGGGGER